MEMDGGDGGERVQGCFSVVCGSYVLSSFFCIYVLDRVKYSIQVIIMF